MNDFDEVPEFDEHGDVIEDEDSAAGLDEEEREADEDDPMLPEDVSAWWRG